MPKTKSHVTVGQFNSSLGRGTANAIAHGIRSFRHTTAGGFVSPKPVQQAPNEFRSGERNTKQNLSTGDLISSAGSDTLYGGAGVDRMTTGSTKRSSGKSKSKSRGKSALRDKVAYAVDAFQRELDVTRDQALGMLGSMAGESGLGLDTKAWNPDDPGGSYGIGQWNNGKNRRTGKTNKEGRKTNLARFAKNDKLKRSPDDFTLQIDFTIHEAKTTHRSALRAVQKAGTSRQASRSWTNLYERPNPDKAHYSGRRKNAEYYRALLDSGEARPYKNVSLSGAAVAPADEAEESGIVDAAYTPEDSAPEQRTPTRATPDGFAGRMAGGAVRGAFARQAAERQASERPSRMADWAQDPMAPFSNASFADTMEVDNSESRMADTGKTQVYSQPEVDTARFGPERSTKNYTPEGSLADFGIYGGVANPLGYAQIATEDAVDVSPAAAAAEEEAAVDDEDSRSKGIADDMGVDASTLTDTVDESTTDDEEAQGDDDLDATPDDDEDDDAAPAEKERGGFFSGLTKGLDKLGSDLGLSDDEEKDEGDDSGKTKERDDSFFGDTSASAAAGSIVGGLIGGLPGAIIGGILGQSVDRTLLGDEEVGDDSGILGGINRAFDSIGVGLRGIFGGDDGDPEGDNGDHDSYDGGRGDRESAANQNRGTSYGFGFGFNDAARTGSYEGSHGEGPGYGGNKSGESKKK